MYEAEKQQRADECGAAIMEVLKHYNCEMLAHVEFLGTQMISQVKFIPR